MSIKQTADNMLGYITNIPTQKTTKGLTLAHAKWMLEGISREYVKGDKAHRWLGWAQAILCQYSVVDLDTLKTMNKGSL